MKRFEPHDEPDLRAADVLFVDALGSRNKRTVFSVAFVALLCIPLVLPATAAKAWLFLPCSLTFSGLFLYGLFCIATNQHWKVTVTRKRVTWDHWFSARPVFVHVAEIDSMWIRDLEPGREIVFGLKNGKSVRIPGGIVTWIDHERLVEAIQQAIADAKSST